MENVAIATPFQKIGARVRVSEMAVPGRPGILASLPQPPAFTIDVARDARGPYFDVRVRPDAAAALALEALDVSARERHLLLLVRHLRDGREAKSRFLCGHDERFWFVAAVPDAERPSTVDQAKESLKPPAARSSQARRGVKPRDRHARKNAGFIRQGEWFFVPAPEFRPDGLAILYNEPLSRGAGSKPHTVERLIRRGGELVYVNWQYRSGLSQDEYARLVEENPRAANWPWRVMRRNPEVFAEGRVTHADHKTVVLRGWHRVLMNREIEAEAMPHVAFLD